MQTVLRLLLRGEDPAAIAAALCAEADRAAALPGARAKVLELQPGVAAQTPHAGYMRGVPFEAALEIAVADAPLADAVGWAAGLAGRVGGVIDAGESYALAGHEYVFSPGESDTVLFVVIGRALTQSFEDHHRHWLNRHGWLVKPGADAAGSGYRQFHADPKASALAARAAGLGRHEFEGIAVGFYPDPGFYLRVMSDAGRLAPILEDERRFIDPETSSPGLYRAVHVTALGEDPDSSVPST
jgi:hypothetical protein